MEMLQLLNKDLPLKSKVSLTFYSKDDNVGGYVDKEEKENVIHVNLTPIIGTDDETLIRMYKMFVLAHEYRHLWQKENNYVFDNDIEYSDRPEEEDANNYASSFMAKHYEELLNN